MDIFMLVTLLGIFGSVFTFPFGLLVWAFSDLSFLECLGFSFLTAPVVGLLVVLLRA